MFVHCAYLVPVESRSRKKGTLDPLGRLEPVVQVLGIEPGLWMSSQGFNSGSIVFLSHPQDTVHAGRAQEKLTIRKWAV